MSSNTRVMEITRCMLSSDISFSSCHTTRVPNESWLCLFARIRDPPKPVVQTAFKVPVGFWTRACRQWNQTIYNTKWTRLDVESTDFDNTQYDNCFYSQTVLEQYTVQRLRRVSSGVLFCRFSRMAWQSKSIFIVVHGSWTLRGNPYTHTGPSPDDSRGARIHYVYILYYIIREGDCRLMFYSRRLWATWVWPS